MVNSVMISTSTTQIGQQNASDTFKQIGHRMGIKDSVWTQFVEDSNVPQLG